jgi:hypothetical protein
MYPWTTELYGDPLTVLGRGLPSAFCWDLGDYLGIYSFRSSLMHAATNIPTEATKPESNQMTLSRSKTLDAMGKTPVHANSNKKNIKVLTR